MPTLSDSPDSPYQLDEYAKNKRRVHKEVSQFLKISIQAVALDKMEFNEHSHKRENQAMDGFLLSLLRKNRYYNKLNMLLPKSLINILKKALRKKIKVDSTLDKKTRDELQRNLASDWTDFQSKQRK